MANCIAKALGTGIRVAGQEQGCVTVAMVNVRLIDARVSTDVSESMPHNHYAGFVADDGF